jgi:ABC-type multidrug transport system fused ATPase/permease subunit
LNNFTNVVRLFDRKDRRRFVLVFAIQVFLGLMDLIGLGLLGIVGAVSVSGIQSSSASENITSLLRLLNLDKYDFRYQVVILASISTLILMLRSLLSVYLVKRIVFFTSRRAAKLSSDLILRFFSLPYSEIRKFSLQKSLFSLTHGVWILFLGVVSNFVILISDIVLLTVMTIGLLVYDPWLAITVFSFFTIIGVVLYRIMYRRALDLGRKESELHVRTNYEIHRVVNAYKELITRNRQVYMANEISKGRDKLGEVSAEITYLPSVSKYVIEASAILGALLISGVQFSRLNAIEAISTLVIFLGASTRIAPAVLRMQQGAILVQKNLGSAAGTLQMIEELWMAPSKLNGKSQITQEHIGFIPNIEAIDLKFQFEDSNLPAIDIKNLTVQPGEAIALIGPSGAGKTTLVDLILGILIPTSGSILVSNVEATEVPRKWPGACAYVPQEVLTFDGTVKENLTFGFSNDEIPDEELEESLKLAGLWDVIKSFPDGIDARLGAGGISLSGGEKQRLGIARSFLTKPRLLVLDEATSALDGSTESIVAQSWQRLRGQVTLIVIAHRLSTIVDFDRVIYFEDGKVLAQGTFLEVCKSVPKLANQESSTELL